MTSEIEYKPHDDTIPLKQDENGYFIIIPESVAHFMKLDEKSFFNLQYNKSKMIFTKCQEKLGPAPCAEADSIKDTGTNAVSNKKIKNNKGKSPSPSKPRRST